MTEGKLANIYIIHHIPYVKIKSDIFNHIYTKQGIIDDSDNILTSDTKDNIANENPLYAEYSTFYWVWKNQYPSEYTGFFQYRRYISFHDDVSNKYNITSENAISTYGWDENTLKNLLDNCDVLLPKPVIFPPFTVKGHYEYHNRGSIHLDVALEIIHRKYPDYIPDCNSALYETKGYFCNMFVMKTYLFDKYMNWIMDIFNELKLELNPPNTVKVFAYLGERLFNVYLHHIIRIYNVKIKSYPWMYVFPKKDNLIDFRLIKPDSNPS